MKNKLLKKCTFVVIVVLIVVHVVVVVVFLSLSGSDSISLWRCPCKERSSPSSFVFLRRSYRLHLAFLVGLRLPVRHISTKCGQNRLLGLLDIFEQKIFGRNFNC